MKVIITPSMSFENVVEEAFGAYIGIGKTSKGHRNSVLMMWGNYVGRERALRELQEFIQKHGSKKAAADELEISLSTFRKIENRYQQLPEALSIVRTPLTAKMYLNEQINLEEDREYEFKECKGPNPVDSIKNTVDEYAVAFLNSEGGSILWGIRDADRIIVGVTLSAIQRDELRQGINNKLNKIQPPMDPSAFRIAFHPVYNSNNEIIYDVFVVEVVVPKDKNNNSLYFTESDTAFVRIDAVKQKLKGPQIQNWIERKLLQDDRIVRVRRLQDKCEALKMHGGNVVAILEGYNYSSRIDYVITNRQAVQELLGTFYEYQDIISPIKDFLHSSAALLDQNQLFKTREERDYYVKLLKESYATIVSICNELIRGVYNS